MTIDSRRAGRVGAQASVVALVVALSASGVAPAGATEADAGTTYDSTTTLHKAPAFAARVPDRTRQVVRTVRSRRWCSKIFCTVTQAWRKRADGRWVKLRTFRSTIGSAGFGKQREGDRRSPNGVYRIKITFSTGDKAPGEMRWRRRRPTSAVSGAPNRFYNTWIEQKWRTDGDRPSMRYGFIVDYNRVRLRPGVGPKPVQGKGSGIFYHTSRPGHRWVSTLGCTQLGNPKAMRWVVQWLDPQYRPRVVQNL